MEDKVSSTYQNTVFTLENHCTLSNKRSHRVVISKFEIWGQSILEVIQAFHTVRIVLHIRCSGPVVKCLNKINMNQSTTWPLGQNTRNTEYAYIMTREPLGPGWLTWEDWSVEWNHLWIFGRVHHEEQYCEIIWIWVSGSGDVILKISYLELWQSSCLLQQNHFWVVQEQMLFKRFLIWSSGNPCLVEGNHLCNFERGHHEEHSCEVMWNLDQRIKRRCRLKTFLILSSGGPFVMRSKTICAILVEGIKRNNSVKLFWIWTSVSGDPF